MSHQTIRLLEQKINDLILLCERIDKENKTLKEEQARWASEKQRLLDKNESAKQRIADMISHLKALETPG